ncbi:hypothetical protein DV735_g4918, partial [Chaetothyriales sp. CBS 134920]
MGSISAADCFEPLFLIIGAGSRGNSYAQAVNASTRGKIGAVAEIDPFKRAEFGCKYIWGKRKPRRYESFSSCDDFISYEEEEEDGGYGRGRITGVFICTLDDSHAALIRALAPLNLHIMCEKPLTLSLSDCLSIKTTLEQYPAKIYSIGHVLRYSPHNIRLRKLLCEEQVIGEVVSIEHTEPIGWWHFSHSYVRGNWRRSTPDAGSLLTKSCHDIDFLLWLLCSPSPLTGAKPHLPTTVMSSGALNHFRKSRKPKAAGNVTNCLRCEAETSCLYSAEKIYRDTWLREKRDTGWPLKIVVPEIEDIVRREGWDQAEAALMDKLAEDWDENTPDEVVRARSWYGRCVYEADNDVCDEQTVVMGWDADPINEEEYGRGRKQALFHMTYPTQAQCQRRGRIYGSLGEITYDSRTITVHTFADGETRTHVIPKQAPEVEKSHGGGDWGLAGAFVNAVIGSEVEGMSVEAAQWKFVGCDLDEIVNSHAVVFAAEEARKKRIVVDFPQWKTEKYAAV